MPNREAWELAQKQALPLEVKIRLTQERIRQWVNEFDEDGVYVSFSGGKDSTVLLHIVRSLYPNIKAVFCDTGLEYPSVRAFVKSKENVDFLKPKMTFKEVIKRYGYPIIGKEVAAAVYDSKRFIEKLQQARQTDRQTDRDNLLDSLGACRPFGYSQETGPKAERTLHGIKEGEYP